MYLQGKTINNGHKQNTPKTLQQDLGVYGQTFETGE
jgi:hypothetical protein